MPFPRSFPTLALPRSGPKGRGPAPSQPTHGAGTPSRVRFSVYGNHTAREPRCQCPRSAPGSPPRSPPCAFSSHFRSAWYSFGYRWISPPRWAKDRARRHVSCFHLACSAPRMPMPFAARSAIGRNGGLSCQAGAPLLLATTALIRLIHGARPPIGVRERRVPAPPLRRAPCG